MSVKTNSGKAYLAVGAFIKGFITEEDLVSIVRDQVSISEVVINPTHTCNLACKHCSYAMKTDRSKLAPVHALKQFMGQAKEEGVQRVVFLGMEPLLDYERTGSLVQHANEIDLPVGMVTNGTLIRKHLNSMKNHKFQYIDVSFDGNKKEHEFNRGKGTFQQSIDGIELLLKHKISPHVNVSATLMSYNGPSIGQLIRRLKNVGVTYFNVGTYIKNNANPRELQITIETIDDFIRSTKDMVDEDTSINIDIHPHIYSFWSALLERGTIDADSILLDASGKLYAPVIGAPPTLTVRNAGFTRCVEAIIITPEGKVLDDYEIVARSDYLQHSIGDIQTDSFAQIVDAMRTVAPQRLVHKVKTILERGGNYAFLEDSGGRAIETTDTFHPC